MRTRCERCGIGYLTRQIGEVCGDRSAAIRLRTPGEAGRIAMLTERPDSCPGLLVRPEDWKLYRRNRRAT